MLTPASAEPFTSASADRAEPASTEAAIDFQLAARLGGEAWAVAMDGSTAFVGGYRDGASRLSAIDLRDPEHPKVVASSGHLRGIVKSIAAHDGTVLAASANMRQDLVPHWFSSWTAFHDSSVAGRLDYAGTAAGCAASDAVVAGSRAYSTCWGPIDIHDISAPGDARLVTRWDGVDADRLSATENLLYAVAQSGSSGSHGGSAAMILTAADVSDAEAPVVTGSTLLQVSAPDHSYASVGGAAHANGYLFVTGRYGWLWSADVQDSSSPRAVARVQNKLVEGVGVAVHDQVVYVVARPSHLAERSPRPSSSQLRAFDVGRPEQPKVIGAVDVPGNAMGVAAGGNVVVVAAGTAGLLVYEPIPVQPGPGVFRAYLPRTSRGEVLVPDAPTPPTDVQVISGQASAVTSVGDVVYAGLGAVLTVSRVLPDGSTVALGRTETLGYRIDEIAVARDESGKTSAYVAGRADERSTFSVIDVSQPEWPRELYAEFSATGARLHVAADGARQSVYVANLESVSDVTVVDVTDRARPRSRGSTLVPGTVVDLDVMISPACRQSGADNRGGRCLVAASVGGMFVLDVSEPDDPRVVSNLIVPALRSGSRVAVDGVLAYLLVRETDLRYCDIWAVDLSTPAAPHVLSVVTLPTDGGDLWADGVNMLVSGTKIQSPQLFAIDISDPRSPATVGELWIPQSRILELTVTASGTLVAVNTNVGLEFVDVNDPRNMTRLGTHRAPKVNDIEAFTTDQSERLLLAARYEGMIELDPSAAQPPRRWPLSYPGEIATAVRYLSGVGYLGTVSGGVRRGAVRAARLGDGSNDWTATYSTTGNVYGLAVVGENPGEFSLLHTAETAGHRVLDESNGRLYEQSFLNDMDPRAVAAKSDNVFLLGTRMWIVDVRRPDTPHHEGMLMVTGTDVVLAERESVAYLATDDGLVVVDTSSRGAPFESMRFHGSYEALAVDGPMLYAAGDDLWAYDIGKPLEPVLVWRRSVPGLVTAIAPGDQRLYVATDGVGVLSLPK